jgi:hypothetical protein
MTLPETVLVIEPVLRPHATTCGGDYSPFFVGRFDCTEEKDKGWWKHPGGIR